MRMTLEQDMDDISAAIKELEANCPWLNDSTITRGYTEYGDKAALCKRPQKVAAGRASARAYQAVLDIEHEHLSTCKGRIKRKLSKRDEMAEESSRLLLRDLFDKCEKISDCISCSCGSAVSAYYNLKKLSSVLQEEGT